MRSMDSRLTDPLGRTITLHDRTWYGHILKGHPEMRPYRRQVERTITDPTEIRLSLTDPACRLYFGRGPRKSVIILAVADINRGFVKTAHLTNKPSGGAIEWSRPTR